MKDGMLGVRLSGLPLVDGVDHRLGVFEFLSARDRLIDQPFRIGFGVAKD
jgi:hypothetical protein